MKLMFLLLCNGSCGVEINKTYEWRNSIKKSIADDRKFRVVRVFYRENSVKNVLRIPNSFQHSFEAKNSTMQIFNIVMCDSMCGVRTAILMIAQQRKNI